MQTESLSPSRSLGVILYELVQGALPIFGGRQVVFILYALNSTIFTLHSPQESALTDWMRLIIGTRVKALLSATEDLIYFFLFYTAGVGQQRMQGGLRHPKPSV